MSAACTPTQRAQAALEAEVLPLLSPPSLVLARAQHTAYLASSLRQLSPSHCSLHASQPWLAFWVVHSLALLDALPPTPAPAAAFLGACASPAGGFSGGPGQQPHLAPTYAACAALATLGGPAALAALDRPSLLALLLRLKAPDGSFRMTEGGEADTRGVYCALAAARLARLLSPELTRGVGDYLARCQSYEGGLGAEPGAEAHGGYSFCGLAAAVLAGCAHRLHLPRLLHWAAHRQGALEGGFNGRTNKLVDGCYSLWQGGLFPLIHSQMPLLMAQLAPCRAPTGGDKPAAGDPPAAQSAARLFPWRRPDDETPPADAPLYGAAALQGWLLACCQAREGGLRDKPGKARDLYHTCYCLSGLSSAQHYGGAAVLGPPDNKLLRTDPALNVTVCRLDAWDALLAAQDAKTC